MKHGVILADPPWKYSCWSGQSSRVADAHYPVMSTQEICDMRPFIDTLASKNCALFMWAVPPMMPDAFKVIEAWGFRYISYGFVWIKTTQKAMSARDQLRTMEKGKPLITLGDDVLTVATGMGMYTRANVEPCLLAVRGKMPVARHDISQVIVAPRTKHSAKPEEQYRRIEQLYPGKRRIELFARQRRKGWRAWGNEIKQGRAA